MGNKVADLTTLMVAVFEALNVTPVFIRTAAALTVTTFFPLDLAFTDQVATLELPSGSRPRIWSAVVSTKTIPLGSTNLARARPKVRSLMFRTRARIRKTWPLATALGTLAFTFTGLIRTRNPIFVAAAPAPAVANSRRTASSRDKPLRDMLIHLPFRSILKLNLKKRLNNKITAAAAMTPAAM